LDKWSKYVGDLVWRHPLLTLYGEITREIESIRMEVFYLFVKFWEGGK
jgi:hypothetical protein